MDTGDVVLRRGLVRPDTASRREFVVCIDLKSVLVIDDTHLKARCHHR